MSNQSPNNNPIKADLTEVAKAIQHRLNSRDLVLLFAYNGTGKTRLSMEFKNLSKHRPRNPETNTLYFNAYTEDLFVWHNDFAADTERYLQMNTDSKFFDGFEGLALETRIESYLQNYVDFDFRIDYDDWRVIFSRGNADFIKVSRGEENIFVWCMFLAIAEIAIEDHELTSAYNWVKYIYIDDPISSLDDNNAIAVGTDLAKLLKKAKERGKALGEGNEAPVKVVVSTHHSLFYNIMEKDLRVRKTNYFLHKKAEGYLLQGTDQSPFFHHVAMLAELKQAYNTGNIKTYHFNTLRTLLEKTAAFFGHPKFDTCLEKMSTENKVLFNRAINLMSHGGYSIYAPVEMVEDNKIIFKKALKAFLDTYDFNKDIGVVHSP